MSSLQEAMEKVFGGDTNLTLGGAKEGLVYQLYVYLSSHPSTRAKLIYANKDAILKKFRVPFARRKMKRFFDADSDSNQVLDEVRHGLNFRVGYGVAIGAVIGLIVWVLLRRIDPGLALPVAGSLGVILSAGLEVLWTSIRNHDKIIVSQLSEGISNEAGSLMETGLVSMERWPDVNAGVEDFHHFYGFLNHEYPKMVNEYLDKSGRKIVEELDTKLGSVKALLDKLKYAPKEMVLEADQITRIKDILEDEKVKLEATIGKTNGTLKRFTTHIKEIQQAASGKKTEIDKLIETKEFMASVRHLVGSSTQTVSVAEEWEIVVSSQLGELVMENQLRIEEASDVLEGEIGRDLFHIEHDIETDMEDFTPDS